METGQHKTVNRSATTQPAASSKVLRAAMPAAGPTRVQAALKISSPRDPAEQEADRVADEVMRMPEGAGGRQTAADRRSAIIQTKPG